MLLWVGLVLPGVLLGGLLGAVIGATLFPRPTLPLGARSENDEPMSMGDIRQYWTLQVEEATFLTVLMDRAVYVVREDNASGQKIMDMLARGEDPNMPLGDLVRLDELESIEISKSATTEAQLVYRLGQRIRRRGVSFSTLGERDEFIAALEECIGKPFIHQEQDLSVGRATRLPFTLLLVVLILVAGVASLAAYWTAHPQPPPRGKIEQDSIVAFLIQTGPNMVALVGGIPLLALMIWLLGRIVRPPRIEVLRRSDS